MRQFYAHAWKGKDLIIDSKRAMLPDKTFTFGREEDLALYPHAHDAGLAAALAGADRVIVYCYNPDRTGPGGEHGYQWITYDKDQLARKVEVKP